MLFHVFCAMIAALIFVSSGLSGVASADVIELINGRKIEGQLYVIKDGSHYIKISKSIVYRVRYAAKASRPDSMTLKNGTVIQGKITAYLDDNYYIRIPSQQVRGVMAMRQAAPESPRPSVPQASPTLAVRDGTIMRIHGSNTIGSKLGPAFAGAYLKKLGAVKIEEVADRDEEVSVRGTFAGNIKPSVIEIHSHGSSTAFADLENKQCDVGAASRRISPQEVEKLAFLGDMTAFRSEHVIGLDGIAVIVNRSNPVFKLGKDEIRKIFSGEISDWSQIGGKAGSINVYARDDKSGTWDTFKGIVLAKSKLTPSARRYEDSSMLSNDVSNDINGIGFIGLPYILNSKAVAVSDSAEPIEPDRFTIATEDYPLSRRLFFYTPGSSDNPYVQPFVEFALSENGQKIVEEIGFVGQNVRLAPSNNSRDFSAQYLKLAEKADRLSVNFRFRKNSFELDTKALRDLHRVIAYLKSETNKGRNVMLFGFTDTLGAAEDNRTLSEKRALTVKRELISKGVNIGAANVVGFGKLNPVASNDTEDGRDKNRRVDIWVK